MDTPLQLNDFLLVRISDCGEYAEAQNPTTETWHYISHEGIQDWAMRELLTQGEALHAEYRAEAMAEDRAHYGW